MLMPALEPHLTEVLSSALSDLRLKGRWGSWICKGWCSPPGHWGLAPAGVQSICLWAQSAPASLGGLQKYIHEACRILPWNKQDKAKCWWVVHHKAEHVPSDLSQWSTEEYFCFWTGFPAPTLSSTAWILSLMHLVNCTKHQGKKIPSWPQQAITLCPEAWSLIILIWVYH